MLSTWIRKLPMKSFISSKKFERSDQLPSCALCPLYRNSWDVPEGDSKFVMEQFKIHLANTHFKTELERMFMSSSDDNFVCCRETFNFQNLIGHIKEEHSIILNMYNAVTQSKFPSMNIDNLNKKSQYKQYISHLMPWLPNSSVNIRPTNQKSGLNCKLCNTRIPGSKPQLNKHYVLAHFFDHMEKEFSDTFKSGVPYKCPQLGCGTVITRTHLR